MIYDSIMYSFGTGGNVGYSHTLYWHKYKWYGNAALKKISQTSTVSLLDETWVLQFILRHALYIFHNMVFIMWEHVARVLDSRSETIPSAR